jgi:hypothetical protein
MQIQIEFHLQRECNQFLAPILRTTMGYMLEIVFRLSVILIAIQFETMRERVTDTVLTWATHLAVIKAMD